MARNAEVIGRKWAAYNEDLTIDGKKPRPWGRQGNASYEENRFISYSTPVGFYHEGPGGKYVTFSTNRYSMSTARHIHLASFWLRVPVFHVPEIRYLPDDQRAIKINHDFLSQAVLEYAGAAMDKWKHGNHSDWRRQLMERYSRLERFCAVTGMAHTMQSWDDLSTFVDEQRQQRHDAFYDPKAVAKRERARAVRIAKQVLTLE